MHPYTASGHKFLFVNKGDCSLCPLQISEHISCYLCAILIGEGHLYKRPHYWNKPIWVYDEYAAIETEKEEEKIAKQLGIPSAEDEELVINSYMVTKEKGKTYSMLTLGWTEKRILVNTERNNLPLCLGCYDEIASGKRKKIFDEIYMGSHHPL